MFLAKSSMAKPSARPLRVAAFLAMAGLGAGFGATAFAQAPAKKPAAPAPTPAPAQAQPAAPAGQQAQQAGPQIINVKSEPSQADWTKVCGKDNGSGTDVCYTTRDFVSDSGQPVMAVALYDMKNAAAKQEVKVVRFLLPLGLMLAPGIRFSVDGKEATAGKFAVCFPNGCFAEAPSISPELLAAQRLGPEPDPARGRVRRAARRLRQVLRRPGHRSEGAGGAAEEAAG